jgi:ParB/RepB/Spo0J family partition protein
MDTVEINVELLVASRTNRKFFDGEALEELARNIANMGVLQPLMVRPLDGGERYELVIGERRWRAAMLAGLATVPCRVRELSDEDAREIQLVENLQRENVDDFEEAEALQGLLELVDDAGEPRYTVSRLAERLSKSRQWIDRRRYLAGLNRPMRDAVRSGKVARSTAELVGQVPVASARKALGEMVIKGQLGREATRELIQREFSKSLKGAPFDREDGELLPEAGPCGACPMRSGNMDEGAKDAWVCCAPGCYQRKCDARWAVVSAGAREAGTEVLSDEESRVQFVDGRHLNYNSPYVIFDARPDKSLIKEEVVWSSLESWRVMVGELVPVVLARVPDSGRSVELARLDLCLTAAVQQGDGELFVSRVLRAQNALAVGSDAGSGAVDLDADLDEDAVDDEPDTRVSARVQKDRALLELRVRVADLVVDDGLYVAPSAVPQAVWGLLIQSAAANLGAVGAEQVQSWMDISESDWEDEILTGRLGGFDRSWDVSLLLSMLVVDWEPAHQERALLELQGYVEELGDHDNYESAYEGADADAEVEDEDAGQVVLPEGWRPTMYELPDVEIDCDLMVKYASGGSEKKRGYLQFNEADDECWFEHSGIVIRGEVIGWDYYDGDEN